MRNEVKHVIFDLGGVLIEWSPKSIAEKFTSDVSLQSLILKDVLLHPDWLELDRGTFCEQEAAWNIAQRSDLSESGIRKVFDTVRESFTVIDDSIEQLAYLTNCGIPCYALSNMSIENYNYLELTHNFFELFEGVVISGYEKMIKPELKIFQLISNRFHLNPEDTLFIDDSVTNCLAAEKVGFQTIHFKKNSTFKVRLR